MIDVQELKSRVEDLSDERTQFMEQFEQEMPEFIKEHRAAEKSKVSQSTIIENDHHQMKELADEDVLKFQESPCELKNLFNFAFKFTYTISSMKEEIRNYENERTEF